MAAYLRRPPAAAPAAVFLVAGFLLGVLWSASHAPSPSSPTSSSPLVLVPRPNPAALSTSDVSAATATGGGGVAQLRWLPGAQFTDSHTVHEGWFAAQVQVGVAVARVDTTSGQFQVPQHCLERVWIDVGAHGVPLRPSGEAAGRPGGLTIAFEPQVNLWQRHFSRDECIISLPMVVTDNSRLQQLRVYAAGNEGSTSLNRVSESAREKWDKKWPGIAAELQAQRVVHVPSIPLAEVLRRLPSSQPTVEFLKVDTQGHDLVVLRSAGDLLRERVMWVKCEVSLHSLYEGQPTKQETLDYLKGMGFEVVKVTQISEGFEEDIWLRNTAGAFHEADLQRHAEEILSQV